MMLVRMTVREFSLGSILVAATEKGICAILLGDAPEALIAELREAFPTERFIEGDEDFDRLADDVVDRVESAKGDFELPLDIRGTEFQRRVWNALRNVPAGATASYKDIASQIGAPENRCPAGDPCHRRQRLDDLAATGRCRAASFRT